MSENLEMKQKIVQYVHDMKNKVYLNNPEKVSELKNVRVEITTYLDKFLDGVDTQIDKICNYVGIEVDTALDLVDMIGDYADDILGLVTDKIGSL